MPQPDFTKLLANGASLSTELTGRMQELTNLSAIIPPLTRQILEQLRILESDLEHEHSVNTAFKKLQAEFKKSASAPLASLVKKVATIEKKYTTFKKAVNDLPAEYAFKESCAALEKLLGECAKSQASMQPQVEATLAKLDAFAEMLLLPEAVFKIKRIERALERLALEITSLVQKQLHLESTPVDLQGLLSKLEQLALVGTQLRPRPHS